MAAQESCALCIVGAGYAGINALNAAARYLPKGARVVVVDRGGRWGGQWPGQYDYVRLHQPYEQFTAGEREWSISSTKPAGHLASKQEILCHFDDVVAWAVEENDLQLITLFGYEYAGHTVDDGKVKLDAAPLLPGSPPVVVTADRLIKAGGFDIKIKEPLRFSSTARVHTLSPVDVLSAKWNALMSYGSDAGAPIWVIGSGKTAMDTMYQLTRRLGPTRGRLRCIAGRGTYFIRREAAFTDDWWELNKPGTRTGSDFFVDMLEMYDGTNEAEVYAEMQSKGFLHSPIDGPTNFLLGMCSTEEVETVRAALSPQDQCVIKGHLMDIIDNEDDDDGGSSDGCLMKVRGVDGTVFTRQLPTGSFVINCTDHIGLGTNFFDPVVSDDGLVLAPQMLCGFSGPSANHLTHAW